MISWTIPTAKITTASVASSASSSGAVTGSNSVSRTFSSSEGQTAGLTESSGSGTASASTFFTASGSTVSGLSGTTSFYSSSSAAAGLSSSTVEYQDLDPPNFTESGQTTFSGSEETTISSSVGPSTAYVQTSTTIEQEADIFSTSVYEEYVSAWTSSYNDAESAVNFYTTDSTFLSTSVYVAGQSTITQEGITELEETQTFGERATVVQANTMLAANADIIYVLDPPEAWNGYSVASALATSGTRFTIEPSYSTEESPVVASSMSPTLSIVNPQISGSISWSAARTTQTTLIAPFSNASSSGLIVVPIQTNSRTAGGSTTTGSTISFTVFGAQTLTYNQAGSSQVTTTSAVTSWGQSRIKTPRRVGNLQFEITQTTATSALRTVTTAFAASAGSAQSGETTSSYASSEIGTGANATSTESASGSTANFNFYIYGTPQATTQAPGLEFDRRKFVTAGAVVGSSKGGWFTADGSFLLPFALDGQGRRGVTVFPTEFSFVTAYSDSVTFTKTQGTETITSSAVIGLAGSSLTTTQNANQSFEGDLSRPKIQGAGGKLPNGMTVVDIAGAGAYKNAIGGSTSSFSGGMTSYSEGQSAPLSCWRAVIAVAPPVLRLPRTPIYWAVARNPSDRSPGAPEF